MNKREHTKLVTIKDCPKYRVPKGLGALVAQNKDERKALDTYLTIKAFTDAPCFADTPEQLAVFSQLNRRHVKTIKTRLKWLCANGLATYNNGFYSLCSWRSLCEHYGLSYKRYTYYKSNSPFFTQKKGYIEHLLESEAVVSRIEIQKETFSYKLKKEPDIVEALHTTVGTHCESNSEAILAVQMCIFAFGNQTDDENLKLLNRHRADFAINGNTLKATFGLTGLGSSVYIKSKMQRLGLWKVEKRQYAIDAKIVKHKYRKTNLGHVHYDNSINKIILTMPDKIVLQNINLLSAY